MNFQESLEQNVNFYVFARNLNKHLVEHNYIMISTVNYSSNLRVYRLINEEDEQYSYFIIDYTIHLIKYRGINDPYWHELDFRCELITKREFDIIKNMATNIQEQLKKIKMENKLKELEKDFE